MMPRIVLFAFCCVLLTIGASPAHASNRAQACHTLARLGSFEKAAACFEAKAEKLKPGDQLSKFDRRIKGLFMVNGAKAYQAAAKKSALPKHQYYLFERSLKLYKRYLKERLCLRKRECRKVQASLYQLNNLIPFAQLTLLNNAKKQAQVKLIGYKFEEGFSVPPNWQGRLRPGSYTMIVLYGGYQNQEISIDLGPKQNKVVSLPPPPGTKIVGKRFPPKRRGQEPASSSGSASWLPWVVVGGGALIAVAGGVLVGLGHNNINQSYKIQERLQQTPNTPPTAQEVREPYDTGSTQVISGWIVGGAGAAILVGGIVWALLPKQPPAPKPVSSRQASPSPLTTLLQTP